MRRPNKPHVIGYEDEEDCEGHYDPDEVERRKCPVYDALHHRSSPLDPCTKCITNWHTKEDDRRKAEWDAKTPDEQVKRVEFLKGLRELY